MPTVQTVLLMEGISSEYDLPPVAEHDYAVCPVCGRSVVKCDMVEHGGELHCPDCVVTCEDCGKTHLISEEGEDDGWVVARTQEYRNHTRVLCIDHAFKCADCGEWFADSIGECNNASEDRICPQCSEHYTSCESCGTILHDDDTCCDERSEQTLCQSCYDNREEEEETDKLLHDYGYKPDPEFHMGKGEVGVSRYATRGTDLVYMGVELEVDRASPPDDREDDIAGAGIDLESFYCKTDGSLDNGFEVVSHPGTWQWWARVDLSYMPALKRKGYRSYDTDTCGMHVHVNKSALTEDDVFKLLEFCKQNVSFVRFIARRKPGKLDQWARVDGSRRTQLMKKAKGRGSKERYEAINLYPKDTIEFRIFRGTLDKGAFLRNLAFVRCLVAFVRQSSLRELTHKAFCQWLKREAWNVLHVGRIAKSLTEWAEGYRPSGKAESFTDKRGE
jgi:hypothetical protein